MCSGFSNINGEIIYKGYDQMKRITALAILFTMLFTFCSFGAKIDGEEIKSTLLNGTTMVPLEDLARLLELDFMPSSEQYAIAEKNDAPRILNFSHMEPGKAYSQNYIRQKDGSLKLTYEEELTLPESAVRIDGKLYVPFRFVAEYFDANVYWSKEEGAWAYRTSYGKTALIRTDGKVRERVALSGEFESAAIVSDYLVLVKGGELLRISLKDGSEKVIGKSGRLHIEGNSLFVLGSGKLTLIDVESGENKTVAEGIGMVGYLAGGGAWCDRGEYASVYDKEGKHLTDVTGKFANPWEYQGGFVYYFTPEMEMRRARPDGSEDEALIKIALYPEWIDGCIYYTDSIFNYRRYDVSTGEDIAVYGLNLENVTGMEGKYIFNFYSEDIRRMFISNPDGTEFKPFGDKNVVVEKPAFAYKDGIAAMGLDDNRMYYITEDKTVKLTDDEVVEFSGIYDGFVYYTIK